MTPENMVKGIDKLKTINNNCSVWLTERGTSFGYSQFIVDFSSVDLFKEYFDEVILDCTHSTHFIKPNGRIGGNPILATRYLKSAPIFGYTGVFAETHPNPQQAYSDGDSNIPLEEMVNLLK